MCLNIVIRKSQSKGKTLRELDLGKAITLQEFKHIKKGFSIKL